MRINVYEQRTTPSGRPQARMGGVPVESTAAGFSAIGRSLEGAAAFQVDEAERLAQERIRAEQQAERERLERERMEEEDEIFRATLALTEARTNFANRMIEAQDDWAPDNPITPRITGEINQFQGQLMEGLRTPRARMFAAERIASLTSDFSTRAFSADRDKRLDYNISLFDRSISTAQNAVFAAPDQYGALLRDVDDGLASLPIDEVRKQNIRERMRRELGFAAEKGSIVQEGFEQYLARRVEIVSGSESNVFAISDPKNLERIQTIQLTQDQSAALDRVSAGDPVKRAFLESVVRIENRGHDSVPLAARSSAGALGPFQFMPATGRSFGLESEDDFKDFDRSADAASKFYQELSRTYNGNVLAMAAHYNGGVAAGRAVMNGDQPPAAETREYLAMLQALMPEETGGAIDIGGGQRARFRSDAPETFYDLTIPERMSLLQDALRGREQQRTVDHERFKQFVRDSQAMAQDGIPPQARPGVEKFIEVFGEKGEIEYENFQRTQQMAGVVAELKQAPNPVLEAISRGDANTRMQFVSGSGYADAAQNDAAIVSSTARILERRRTDPAGEVQRTSPQVQAAFQAAMNENVSPEDRPALMQAAIEQQLAAQRNLGILSPRVLSDSMAADIANRITTAPPEDAANVVLGLQSEFGRHFPAVMTEVANRPGVDIPAAYRIIPGLTDPYARERVAALGGVKASDLRAAVDPSRVIDMNIEVGRATQQLALSMPITSQSGQQLISAHAEMIEKLALQRMATTAGISMREAVQEASSILFRQYEFVSQDSLFQSGDSVPMIRVPAEIAPALPRRALVSALRKTLAQDIIPSFDSIDIPEDITGAYNEEEAREQWRGMLTNSAAWYTTPDNSGVHLWAMGADGRMYRVKRGGQQVQLSFAEIIQRSREKPSVTRVDLSGIDNLPQTQVSRFE